MPGRLMAEHNVLPTKAPTQPVGKQPVEDIPPNNAITSTDQQASPLPEAPSPSRLNGLQPPNGTSVQDIPSTTPAEKISVAASLPPELAHITQGFQPLSRLFGRVSQECFNGLNDLISQLAEQTAPPQVNGINAVSQTSASGAQKRLQWLNFANSQRERFIKMLVILQWSKRVGNVKKLIDVNAWITHQQQHYGNTEWHIGELRRNMAEARVPAPDIETALEVLTNGSSSRFNDFMYIPPEPLSAQRLLKELKDLNVLLHIRLNLHDDLPVQFNDYTIGSGRVTFKVESEFELDLSIGDDDPSSQFWFVDFRLLFPSVSEIPNAQMRLLLEDRINRALAAGGLAESYEMLHEFTLTHRINLLRRQALEMSRGPWTGSLRVENLHRSLVVQYWSARPGKKSWVQIGIRSSLHDTRQVAQQAKTAHIFAKCFRDGKEIEKLGFTVDDQQWDMESILKIMIAAHVSSIMHDVKDRFEETLADSVDFPIQLSESESELLDARLDIPLNASAIGSILIEPISGDFALRPVTTNSTRYESILNDRKEKSTDLFPVLESWRASEIQSSTELCAENAGLRSVILSGLGRDTIRTTFGTGILRTSFFNTPEWAGTDWYIAVSISSQSQSWWVTRISTNARGTAIAQKESIKDSEGFTGYLGPSPGMYADLERLAVATVFQSVLCAHLRRLAVPHMALDSIYDARGRRASMTLDGTALLNTGAPPEVDQATKPSVLAEGATKLELHGLVPNRPDGKATTYMFRGQLNDAIAKPHILPELRADDLEIDAHAKFALSVQSRLGSLAPIDQFVTRMCSLQRLAIFLDVLHQHKLPWESVHVSSIRFRYSKSPSLAVTIDFSSQQQGPVLSLHPATSNTHIRIFRRLDDLLHTPGLDLATKLHSGLRILSLSLPLLRYLDTLESADRKGNRIRIHIRGLSDYLLGYPRLDFALRVRIHQRRGLSLWLIEPVYHNFFTDLSSPRHASAQKLQDGLKALLAQSGDGYTGLTEGVAAESRAVAGVLASIDRLGTECELLALPPRPKRIEKPAETQKAQEQSQAQGQVPIQQQDKTVAQKGKLPQMPPQPNAPGNQTQRAKLQPASANGAAINGAAQGPGQGQNQGQGQGQGHAQKRPPDHDIVVLD